MRTRSIILIAAIAVVESISGQAGTLDPAFNPLDVGYGAGDGFGYHVTALAVQPDGKTLVGGRAWNGLASSPATCQGGLCRLNADGSIDTSFSAGQGAYSGFVEVIAVQADGKILVGGSFNAWIGAQSRYLVRLNSDGSVDQSFNIGWGPDDAVRSIALHSNGMISIGGDFTTFNFTNRSYLIHLDQSGNEPIGFGQGAANGPVHAIAIQSNGQLIIGGEIVANTYIPSNGIIRLNQTGFLDPSFNPGSGANDVVRDIAIHPNGNIVFGGDFTMVNGVSKGGICELDPYGGIVGSFNSAVGFNGPVFDVEAPANDRILVSGAFDSYNNSNVGSFCQLTTSGSIDPQFQSGSSANAAVNCIVVRTDGRIAIAGEFTEYDNSGPAMFYSVLEYSGSIADIHSQNGLNGYGYERVMSLLLKDGRILIAGDFDWCRGSDRNGVAIINQDGLADNSFMPGTGLSDVPYGVDGSGPPRVRFLAEQDDGKVLLGGYLFRYKETLVESIVRIDTNGVLDTTWMYQDDQPWYSYQPIRAGFLAKNQDVYVIDEADTLRRLSPFGVEYGSFTNSVDSAISLTEDLQGRFLVCGYFNECGGSNRKNIVRIDSIGAVDTSFNAGPDINGSIAWVRVRPNGRILIGGSFSQIQGVPMSGIAQLQEDGSLDTSFIAPPVDIRDPIVQLDGKLILGGRVRLSVDGSLDASFITDFPEDQNRNTSSCLLPNGDIIITGDFENLGSVGRNRIARVKGSLDGQVFVSPRVMLEGPFEPGTVSMHDSLRSQELIPLQEPYTGLGYAHPITGLTETNEFVLSLAGDQAIVDWVLLEVRSAATPTHVFESKAGLLRKDGKVVRPDGFEVFGFNLPTFGYYISLVHRNHLGTMAGPVLLNDQVLELDFTDPTTSMFGADAQKNVNGTMVMWSGDVSFDGELKYMGSNNDRDAILVGIGGAVPTNTSSGYLSEDVNMDGTVKYIGAANDRDPILINIGGSIPTAVRSAQLP